MSANKPDISQLRKYLNGELDAKAMHRLEREAQDDPFLMDALEGYEFTGDDQQANLDELQQRLADRVAPKKERSIILWRVLPIAASLLIAISIGYWFLKPNPDMQKAVSLAVILPPPAKTDKLATKTDSTVTQASAQTLIAHNAVPSSHFSVPMRSARVADADEPTDNAAFRNIKMDTAQYAAGTYAMRTNTAADVLKNLPGVNVDANGNVTSQGTQVNQVRINGNSYFGNNVNLTVKNLPAEVIKNIQIIDDYGDQAAKTGIKSGEPNKILDIKTDTGNMQRLALNNALAGRVPGINVNARQLNEVAITGYNAPAKKEVLGSVSSIAAKPLDSALYKEAKAKKATPDSVSYLAEVVVPGYADKNNSPVKPVSGWKQYLTYVKEMAVMLDNSVGKVKLAFKVGKDGNAYDIRIVKGNTMAMNQKAIEIVKNGPVWTRGSNGKEITLKIKFRKGS